ncbi:MAG TPA: hypothetical protein DCG57_21975 [Candidatus Riflebacteria bacterium]|jgi:predicted alpha/beta superfamily hydrolase|nr:hypothetical protein [Candidatus Riflebacteria bacterium]
MKKTSKSKKHSRNSSMQSQNRTASGSLHKINLNISLKSALPGDDSLFITGSTPELGEWDPAGRKLEPRSDGTYALELAAPAGSIVECKITRGSWKTQGIYDPEVVPPDNLVIKVNQSRNIDVNIVGWLDQRDINSDPVQGRLVNSGEFPCKGLKYKRSVQVWLPDSYQSSGKPCAVIYMHDGQNLFEPGRAFAGVDWKVDETVTRMIASGEIRPCIVVGIPNSPDRMKELNLFTEQGKAYAEFVVNEIKPWVEANFNVSGQAQDNALMGSSMGGLISFQMLYAYENRFALAACLSSAFQKTGGKIFHQVSHNNFKPVNARLYLDAGEFEPPIARSYFDMMNQLKENGFIEGHNLMGYYEEHATHCEARWAARLHLPLKFLLGKI